MHSPSLLLTAALEYAARGWRVIPLHTPTGHAEQPCSCLDPRCDTPGKHPRIREWQKQGTTDAEQIRKWWGMWPESNIGIVCGAGSGWFALDVDGEEGEETLRRLVAANSELPETPEQITGSGGRHLLFAYEPGLSNAVKFAPGLDIRTDGGQIVVEPSLHPNGNEYHWELAHHPAEMAPPKAPGWLLTAIRKAAAKPSAVAGPVGQQIPDGERNSTLASLAGSMRRRGFDTSAIEAALLVMNRDRCRPMLDEAEVRQIAQSIGRYEPAVENNSAPFVSFVSSVSGVEHAETAQNEGSVASVTSVAGDARRPDPPADLEPEALYGLAGDIVNAISPHTESHPAAVLASFLTGVGCLIGPGPHVYRDGARHGCNEFACLVGLTASGRKGTATRRTDEVFLYLSNINNISFSYKSTTCHEEPLPLWYDRTITGLGSGEALVSALAEGDETLDSGPDDRRRIVFEEEFSKALKVMRREGSTLSENLRSAWDGSVLTSRTKGRVLRGRGHVSILGHITLAELTQQMGTTEVFNGFANRFLWIATRRVRLLPFGGGEAPIAPVVSALQLVLNHVPHLGRMEFNEEAKALWDQGGLYQLLTERPPGLLGSVTARAEAHVTRLALIYAVLEASSSIRVDHLLAALAVWDYSEKTCASIFGTSLGDDYADQIRELLAEVYPGGLTRTELRDRFKRHAEPGRIPKALALLQDEGFAVPVKVETGGRPTEYWQSRGANPRDRSDRSDETPLERARRLISERATP